jgi:hypothetical protein
VNTIRDRRRLPAMREPPERRFADDVSVVAVDGSEASVRALIWGLRHAAEHGLTVEVLTAWPVHGAMVHDVPGHFNDARWHAREVQAAAMAKALAVVEHAPPYNLSVANATAADALIRAAAQAALLVLGSDEPPSDEPPSDEPPSAAPPRVGNQRTRLTEQVRRLAVGRVVVVRPEPEQHDQAGDLQRPAR